MHGGILIRKLFDVWRVLCTERFETVYFKWIWRFCFLHLYSHQIIRSYLMDRPMGDTHFHPKEFERIQVPKKIPSFCNMTVASGNVFYTEIWTFLVSVIPLGTSTRPLLIPKLL